LATSASDEPHPGVKLGADGAAFTVRAPQAHQVWVCLYDDEDRETARLALPAASDGLFSAFVPGLTAGQCYGLRADGPFEPERGHRFDPAKLLVDPFAVRINRPFAWHPDLARFGVDTAHLVPRAVLEPPLPDRASRPPLFVPGCLVYELPVRAFTILHPAIPLSDRGTLRALAHPAVIEHLRSLHVTAVELMPIAAWIDERHLAPLGLTNAWGYNPVTMLALDPRLAPGGVQDLRFAVDALRDAGIGVLVDVVYNHTGESDADGATLSLRGLGNAAYYRHHRDDPGQLVNDTGCGNTLACDRPEVKELALAAMRFLVSEGGVDGFRFDLAPVLGRDQSGFSRDAVLLEALRADPLLADRVFIAEPWDIGPGGYQLGCFKPPWLEWNDQARDDTRRYWRGDASATGGLATRLAGSSDIFSREGARTTRSINFVAAHDGFPLGDLVAFAHKHNQGNGEDNRDGHGENLSWNNGVEGETSDAAILAAREADARALIATLFVTRGTILLTAGDEFGHSQGGNNNAYAQDNAVTWRDWSALNADRLAFTRAMAAVRANSSLLTRTAFLMSADGSASPDQIAWLKVGAAGPEPVDWSDSNLSTLMMLLGAPGSRLSVLFNRGSTAVAPQLPESQGSRGNWLPITPGFDSAAPVPPRSVAIWREA